MSFAPLWEEEFTMHQDRPRKIILSSVGSFHTWRPHKKGGGIRVMRQICRRPVHKHWWGQKIHQDFGRHTWNHPIYLSLTSSAQQKLTVDLDFVPDFYFLRRAGTRRLPCPRWQRHLRHVDNAPSAQADTCAMLYYLDRTRRSHRFIFPKWDFQLSNRPWVSDGLVFTS